MAGACSAGDQGDQPLSPTPAYTGRATIRTIEATTQMHLKGVAIGVGNIWEEEYTPVGGTPLYGLTAALFLSVERDASQSRHLRVHAGQDVNVPGYRLHVVSVEPTRIQLEVIEVTE